jgi:hypothetical protein
VKRAPILGFLDHPLLGVMASTPAHGRLDSEWLKLLAERGYVVTPALAGSPVTVSDVVRLIGQNQIQ